MDLRSRFRGALLGLAVGDALGTTLEFRAPGTFDPIDDLVGGGPFNLEAGQWTDDTSMALCLATSLIAAEGFDPRDQMERYDRWAREGYLSSTGTCFDIGNTVRDALYRFRETGEPYAGSTAPTSAGNGCLMRLAPIAMFFFGDVDRTEHYSAQSSRTTHGTAQCVDACRLFGRMLHRALEGASRDTVLQADAGAFEGHPAIASLARGSYRHQPREEIRGTGYVVDSMKAALWCFARTDNYRDAVLSAANLGDDADTTAAICGQLAGAFYGEDAIPEAWKARLAMREHIEELALGLLRAES